MLIVDHRLCCTETCPLLSDWSWPSGCIKPRVSRLHKGFCRSLGISGSSEQEIYLNQHEEEIRRVEVSSEVWCISQVRLELP